MRKIVITPKSNTSQYLKDLFNYKDLFLILAWRDFSVRYKQTVIGILWAIIRPFLTMIIFTIVFGKIAKLPSEGVPYPILVFSGMLPWNFFTTTFVSISDSLISNPNLITKVYFPRLIIPATPILVNTIDFIISLIILIIIMFIYNFVPSWQFIFIPLFFIILIILTYGLGAFISTLNVKYRDFKYVIPFIIQLGMYISPVAYSSTIIPEKYKLLYALNPLVGIIDGFRWAISGGKTVLNIDTLLITVIESLLIFVFGIIFFKNFEKEFADII